MGIRWRGGAGSRPCATRCRRMPSCCWTPTVLVECRNQPLQNRLGAAALRAGRPVRPEAAVNVHYGAARLAEAMLTARQHDESAVLYLLRAPAGDAEDRVTSPHPKRPARCGSRRPREEWGPWTYRPTVLQIVRTGDQRVEHAALRCICGCAAAGSRLTRCRRGRRPGLAATPNHVERRAHRGLYRADALRTLGGGGRPAPGKVMWSAGLEPCMRDARTVRLRGRSGAFATRSRRGRQSETVGDTKAQRYGAATGISDPQSSGFRDRILNSKDRARHSAVRDAGQSRTSATGFLALRRVARPWIWRDPEACRIDHAAVSHRASEAEGAR